MRKVLPLPLILVLFIPEMNAQLTASDSTLLNKSIENIISFHNKALKENIHLYIGSEHTGFAHFILRTPYFMDDSLQFGTVLYNDTYYKNVPMQYDLEQDNVVILKYIPDTGSLPADFSKPARLNLVKEKISFFTLAGHEFVRLEADSNATGMPAGFYERRYNGQVKFFVKRHKFYTELVKGLDLERRYDLLTRYYLLYHGKYFNIRSPRVLPAIFKEKKKEVNAYMRSIKKKYKKDTEQLIFETTRYYDHLARE